jgi:IMP dehydrogenase
MLNGKIIQEAYTFDDVLLVPAYSKVLPNEVSLKTQLTKNITLNMPILSAAMDTVTDHKMAIAMALSGALGFIHKNMSIEAQAQEVVKVKAHQVDRKLFANACLDTKGALRVGVAVGIAKNLMERTKALVEAGADIVTLDSAHGHSQGIIDAVKAIATAFPNLDIIAGNIVTASAAQILVDAGASAVKVGVGPGSICTTRVVAGVGVPQLTAVNNVYEQLKNQNIGIIADGGIKHSGEITKAIAAGAHCVMLGSLLAGTDESPGEVLDFEEKKYKSYVGMGSLVAMERGSKDRYFQENKKKLVPEGIEALKPYKGSVSAILFQLIGGLRSGMGYCGTKNIEILRHEARFVKISNAGLIESHPHDVVISKDAPNYNK